MTLTSLFKAGPGGVMTDDVGVVTGDLELRTTLADDGALTVEVRYEGADEWYRLLGRRLPAGRPQGPPAGAQRPARRAQPPRGLT